MLFLLEELNDFILLSFIEEKEFTSFNPVKIYKGGNMFFLQDELKTYLKVP